MVSTTLGCEGIDVRDGTHLLVADDPQVFAQAVAEVLGNPDRAAMLGRHGRTLMEDEYSWDIADTRLAALYARVMNRSAARHSH
jgi:glycosyltransferase involved in cell wall biosynthesis